MAQWILAIETSCRVGSVALLEDDNLHHELTFEEGMVHGTSLAPATKELLQRESLSPGDLAGIAVSIGPGSYTGLRIGAAFAKTLAYVAHVPVVAVRTLHALALNLEDGPVCSPILNARLGEIYAARFRLEDGRWISDTDDRVGPSSEWIADQPDETIYLGDGVTVCRAELEAHDVAIAPEDLWIPSAANVGRIGADLLRAGETADIVTLVPRYLRPSTPEMRKRKDAS